MPILPELFTERLKSILPADSFDRVLAAFSAACCAGVRVNLLKIDVAEGRDFLQSLGVGHYPHPAVSEAFIVQASARERLRDAAPFQDGRLYWQTPSSLLPAAVLDPVPGERVLDMCAAPGSKTTQMAARMANAGEITAIEAVRSRFYKLKTVASLMGARIHGVLGDGRRFRPGENLFDKVLLDAPCSSEGRFDTRDKESLGYWSQHKIREMAHKQKGLLLNASRCVKPGGVLVYSTCTFAPEENEAVVDWFLRKAEGELALESFDLPGVPRYPVLRGFAGREYKHDLSACWRVLPDSVFSGFFIAKFIKAGDGRSGLT